MSGKLKIERNTAAEEAAIQRGIAADPDAAELTDEQLAEMRPASDAVPAVVAAMARRRGKGRKPAKDRVTLRLDHDLVLALRASGRGWQGRANDLLRQAVIDEKR